MRRCSGLGVATGHHSSFAHGRQALVTSMVTFGSVYGPSSRLGDGSPLVRADWAHRHAHAVVAAGNANLAGCGQGLTSRAGELIAVLQWPAACGAGRRAALLGGKCVDTSSEGTRGTHAAGANGGSEQTSSGAARKAAAPAMAPRGAKTGRSSFAGMNRIKFNGFGKFHLSALAQASGFDSPPGAKPQVQRQAGVGNFVSVSDQ